MGPLYRIVVMTCCAGLLWTASAAGQTDPPETAPPGPEQAQTDTEPAAPPRFQGGVGLVASAALGDFGANIESAGGISGHLAAGLGESIVTLGGEVAYLWYGEESREVPFSVTIPDVLVKVNTSNAMFLMHARVRAQPRHGRWRPYVDGLLGFTDIFTKTSIDNANCFAVLDDSCRVAGSTNLRDVVLSYGAGAGVMVEFGSPPSAARLDISLRYLRGGEANYLREGAIQREGGQAFLDINRSRTDMILIFIGVSGGR